MIHFIFPKISTRPLNCFTKNFLKNIAEHRACIYPSNKLKGWYHIYSIETVMFDETAFDAGNALV